ncbi:chromosome segregation protein SMC [Lacticaseibacillus daqingensis]|uniref:chromosome segregation protein SMC n=1 Tax=Lacticaseibacillus daqingensis TaxID=2486014 RepID=UPI000F7AC593|nr:chromosome segregation protein SMC [Lacticaseibacillus daqingensis]
MQLTHLTINGFKSFADKTEIAFVSGLTGIVGPNGSGKSNITEAIRWTLGEQSAKSLRGEKMGDVIFAGTAARPPLNRAEVAMTFDNSDGYLHDQPATVTVCRRLYRDGESDFLINNQAVRLKDIVDLFMDSGLGKESFSFISQGRVEAIFNSKPEDRRGILEEAAGVLKYKQQKQKAERELKETDDNLDRVNDIITELHHQVTPLAEQASVARDYERQTADYTRIHKSILALEIAALAEEQDATRKQAQVTKQTVTALTAQAAHLEEKSEALTAKDQDFETQLNRVNDQLLSESMRLENLTGEANLSTERVNNAQATLSELQTQRETAVASGEEAETHIKALKAQQTQQAKQLRDLAAQLANLDAGAKTPAELNRQLEAAQTAYIDLLRQQADTKNQLNAAKKDQQVAASQNEAEHRRIRELTQRVTAQQEDVTTLDTTLAQLTTAEAAAKQAHEQATATATAAQAAYADANQRLNEASTLYQRAKSRYETLQELKDDYAGFYTGVRAVLKNKAQLPGVIGAVAELLSVPAEYQQAMDVALGGNLQAVVTTTEQAAKQAISYLKQTRAGRATFLPTAVVRPRSLPDNVLRDLADQPGYVGVGADLVRFREEVGTVMRNLLGSLIVAETLDAGIRLANLSSHRYRIVTLDGDILTPGGAMTGGQTKKTGVSPLARTQEVTQLHARLRQMTTALATQQTKVTDLQAALTAAQQAATTAREQWQQAQATLAAQQAQHNAQLDALTQLQRQQKALQLSVDGGHDFAGTIATLSTQADQIDAELATQQALIDSTKAALAQASQAAEVTQATMSRLQTEQAVAKHDQSTTATQLKQWQETAATSRQAVAKLTDRIEKITQAAAENETDKKDRAQTIATLEASTKQLRQRLDQLTKTKAANRGELSQVSAQITTTYTQQHQAMADSEQQSVSLNRIKINLENRLATLAETYQLTYEAALAATTAKAADLPMLRAQLKLLKRGIDELGPVNPNAITEYENVKERYDFLTKQQADLLDAKQQLLATMGELDEEVKGRFKEMFDATNAAFTDIFPKMFGGGAAHLSLTDPSDLLNTGLEISAQPPGKKLQRLSLLSGGERALTAIVLLFAILQVRPVPFSILDEVEASLDEVNVNRFGEFLKHYSSDTQFIVITHRRGTMLAANMLYGVTMQESGVSKMVAVSLDQLTQDATPA